MASDVGWTWPKKDAVNVTLREDHMVGLHGSLCTVSIIANVVFVWICRLLPCRSLSPFGMLICNLAVSNIIQSVLQFFPQFAMYVSDMNENATKVLSMVDEENYCDYPTRMELTGYISVPLAQVTQHAINILGVVIAMFGCLVDNSIETEYADHLMNFTRAKFYIAMSWTLSGFILLHPVLISCAGHALIVTTCTWLIIALLLTLIAMVVSCMTYFKDAPQLPLPYGVEPYSFSQKIILVCVCVNLLLTLSSLMMLAPLAFLRFLKDLGKEAKPKGLHPSAYALLAALPYVFHALMPVLLYPGHRHLVHTNEGLVAADSGDEQSENLSLTDVNGLTDQNHCEVLTRGSPMHIRV